MRTALIATHLRSDAGPRRVLWTERLRARWWAGRHDRDLDRGVTALPGSALALHAARITTPAERQRLAADLTHRLDASRAGNSPASARIPLRCSRIIANEALIGDIVDCLCGTRPVHARGIARLRVLLADGTGPLYTSGTGSVAAALRGVHAAL